MKLAKKFIDLKEAAEYLGCGKKTVRTYIKDKGLPAYRLGPHGNYKFDCEELNDFLKAKCRV